MFLKGSLIAILFSLFIICKPYDRFYYSYGLFWQNVKKSDVAGLWQICKNPELHTCILGLSWALYHNFKLFTNSKGKIIPFLRNIIIFGFLALFTIFPFSVFCKWKLAVDALCKSVLTDFKLRSLHHFTDVFLQQ